MGEQCRQLRIGVIGTGAIGGYYGLLLERAGHEVHFLARSEYVALRDQGLCIQSDVWGEARSAAIRVYEDVAAMPPCDWLLVGTKTTSNAELAPLLMQALKPGGGVVLLQNGLGVEDDLRTQLPDTLNLVGGLCFICVHREAPGVIRHQAYGGVSLGWHSGPNPEGLPGLVEVMRNAGIEAQLVADLAQARWQKLVWNMPFNGLSVLLRCGTAKLLGCTQGTALLDALMIEVISAARACGHDLPSNLAQAMLAATVRMPDYLPSMYHDAQQGRPLELEAIYARPLRAGREAGVEMPRVEMLWQTLACL